MAAKVIRSISVPRIFEKHDSLSVTSTGINRTIGAWQGCQCRGFPLNLGGKYVDGGFIFRDRNTLVFQAM